MYDFNIGTLLFDLILTMIIYLTIPVILKYVLHKKYNKKQSKKISIGTAILGYVIYIILYRLLEIDGIPKMPVALFYGFISYKILYNSNTDIKEIIIDKNDEKEEKVLQNLIEKIEEGKNTGIETLESEIEEKNVDSESYNEEPLHIIENVKKHNKHDYKKLQASLNEWKIATITLTIVTIIATLMLVFLVIDVNELKNKKEELESTITSQKTSYKKLQEKYSECNSEKYELQQKVTFFDNHAVIIPANTKVYHRYDCTYCDRDSFYILNDGSARAQGYIPCSHCIK